MPFRLLKGFNPWEIIIKDLETNEEISLSNRYKSLCPVCYYPIEHENAKECHIDIQHQVDKFYFITGHFYETDYKGHPLNWFSKSIKEISSYPFKFSHELLKLILLERIMKSDWNLSDIEFSTMVPTTNQQMEQLFSEISAKLGISWFPSNRFFTRKELTNHYKDRRAYVENKYFLKEDQLEIISNLDKNKSIIVFDDIFHQGFTLGRIIDLLFNFSVTKFKLVTIARTVPKSFLKAFYFP